MTGDWFPENSLHKAFFSLMGFVEGILLEPEVTLSRLWEFPVEILHDRKEILPQPSAVHLLRDQQMMSEVTLGP